MGEPRPHRVVQRILECSCGDHVVESAWREHSTWTHPTGAVRIPLWSAVGVIGYAIVDEADLGDLSRWRWHLSPRGYTYRREKDRGAVLMHRYLLGLEKGDPRQGDHINRDRLDNRRTNLRIVTQQHNLQNRTAGYGKSRYRGVTLRPNGRWRASAGLNGRRVHIGNFGSELEAAAAAAEWRAENMPFAGE